MSRWIERQRNILDLTLSSLLRRKRKNTALFAAYTLVVFLLASVMFMSHALKREAAAILAGSPEMIVQKISAGRHDLIAVDVAVKLGGLPGVQEARPRLWGYYYDPVTGANFTLVASGEAGLDPGRIAVGEGVARMRLASVGDSIEFKAHDGSLLELEVGEILSRGSALVSSDLVLVTEADFRRLFGTPAGLATDIVLRVRNARELPTIALKAAEIYPDTRQVLRDDLLRTYQAVFDWRGGLLVIILGGGLLAFIIFSWDKATGLSAEARREIGILKAVGWETSDVILMKSWEGMAVSLTAFLGGILLAYVHVFLTSGVLFAPVLKGWSVLYPAFRLVPYIDLSQLAALFFLTVLPYTVATVIPTWRAATVDPDQVMR
jgi:ABC-type lipoprotein release transport system permease subunit